MKMLILLLLAGGLGGLAGIGLRIPGGTLVGAMVAVILFKSFSSVDYTLPRLYVIVVQILVGVMVGAGYTPQVAHRIYQMIWPVLLSTVALVLFGLGTGLLFSRYLGQEPVTGYLATSPGAMSSLIPLAVDMNAQPTVVAAFHFFRLVFIVMTAPLLSRLVQALSRGG